MRATKTHMPTFRCHHVRGTTLVELLIVFVIVSVAWAAFLIVTVEGVYDLEYVKAMNLVTEWNQAITSHITDDVVTAKQFFEDDAVGTDYFDALSLDPESSPLSTTRLPTIDETGDLGADTPGDEKTGNGLFFAKVIAPFVATVPYTDTETYTYRINVYRLVTYYLTWRYKEDIGRGEGTLDLVRWSSRPVADYSQIMSIDDPDPSDGVDPREEMVAAFVEEYNSTWLWDSGEEVDDAFYECDADGDIDAHATNNMIIPQDPDEGIQSLIPSGVTGTKHASICFNRSVPGWDTGPIVPQFGIEDDVSEGFPHGFEVQIVGPSGAREVLVRLALAKGTSRHVVARDFMSILTTRDF